MVYKYSIRNNMDKTIRSMYNVCPRPTVLQQLHNCAKKTSERVKERYYWPGYEGDTEKWVRECKECQ